MPVNAAVKCLVWDLDGTLWSGTVLEHDQPVVAERIRDVVLELDRRGILQSVASRNDHDLAWSHVERLGLADYFLEPQISWGRKSDAVRTITERLGFAESAMAFIDDQPAERAEVAFHLPQVRCYDATSVTTLTSLPEFSPDTVTEDARRRRERYQAARRRDAARANHRGADEDFLRSLDLRLTISHADDATLARVAELTLRTSQMNATGVHYSQDTLGELIADPDHDVLVASLTDRFGSHGAIGVLLIERGSLVWRLKLLATSCRVVSLGTGGVILRWLIDEAVRAGVHVYADFRPTDRNRMMEIAYAFAGFQAQPCPRCPTPTRLGEDVQLLHLAPTPVEAPSAVHVDAPVLARADV